MNDFRDSAAVPLDDIDEMKGGIRELREDQELIRKNLHNQANALMEQKAKIEALDRGNLEILKRIDANTELTNDIKSLVTFGKVGRQVVIWLGGFAGGLAGLVSLWESFRK